MTSHAVTLHPATPSDLACIENMMQFYSYDFSAWYPLSLSDNGLFAIRAKGDYWARPDVRPFLIRVNGELAGFAVVDAQVVHAASEHTIGYFFVARRYRGEGVGRQVATQLLRRYSGAWEVYWLTANQVAGAFWPGVIDAVAATPVIGSDEVIDGDACRLLRFATITPVE